MSLLGVGLPLGILGFAFAGPVLGLRGMGPWEEFFLVGLLLPPILTSLALRWRPRSRRLLAWTIPLPAVVLWVVVAYATWSFQQFGTQLENLVLMQIYEDRLEEWRSSHGEYPRDLGMIGDELDAWGRPMRYDTTGDAYVLVSHGRGGEPDGNDPWAMRESHGEGEYPESICEQWPADQILTDRGFLTMCGK